MKLLVLCVKLLMPMPAPEVQVMTQNLRRNSGFSIANTYLLVYTRGLSINGMPLVAITMSEPRVHNLLCFTT